MLETLLKLYYKAHLEYQSLILELTHDKICDWTLSIMHRDSDTTIFYSNSVFLTDLAAQAYLNLRRWLDEKDTDTADKCIQEIL